MDTIPRTSACQAVVIMILLSAGAQVIAQQRDELDTQTITANQPVLVREVPDLKLVASSIAEQTNEFRSQAGLSPLRTDQRLESAATSFAEFMASTDTYGHTADGKRPSDRAREYQYDACIVAENIAYQFRSRGFDPVSLARVFVEGWKNSPEHRANLLDEHLMEWGVSVRRSGNSGYFYAVQLFGRPRSAAIRFQIANTSDSAVHYRLADRAFDLPPRFTRTHEICVPEGLSFYGTEADDEQPRQLVEPANGDRLVVVSDQRGGVLLERIPARKSTPPSPLPPPLPLESPLGASQ
jgi:uncharacterized protein YkwD